MRRVSLFLVVLLLFASAIPSTLAQSSTDTSAKRTHQRMLAADATKILAETGNYNAVSAYLQRQGLKLIQPGSTAPDPVIKGGINGGDAASDGTVSPESTDSDTHSDSNDVSVGIPSVWWDPAYNQYILATTIRWLDDHWKKDAPMCMWPFDCNIGGQDLWAIVLSNSSYLRLDYQIAYFMDDKNNTIDTDQPAFNSGDQGVAFEWQDKIITHLLGSDSNNTLMAYVYMYMDPVADGTVTVRSRMAHTWSTSQITGGGFSSTGLSLNFTNQQYKWDVQSSRAATLSVTTKH